MRTLNPDMHTDARRCGRAWAELHGTAREGDQTRQARAGGEGLGVGAHRRAEQADLSTARL
jgi:hypothetical protein